MAILLDVYLGVPHHPTALHAVRRAGAPFRAVEQQALVDLRSHGCAHRRDLENGAGGRGRGYDLVILSDHE